MKVFASIPPALPHRSTRRRLGLARAGGASLDGLARVGYVAHGVVYLLVGALAARVAFLHEGKAAGPKEALSQVNREAPGLLGNGAAVTVLLALIAAGLFAYAGWRMSQALLDPDGDAAHKQHSALLRVARFISGALYTGVAFTAAKLALGRGGSGGDQAPEWTARALAAPFGVAWVAAAGLVIIAIGVLAAKKAWTASFLKELEVSGRKRQIVERLGRAGYAARALVFAVVGSFVVVAAVQHDAEQARGLAGALQALAAQPWGQLLLAATALGLVAFGAFEVARGLTRRRVA